MERKIVHRMIGIVVVIGLAVILFPFFVGSHDKPVETALVKAPPFPEQTTPPSINVDEEHKVAALPAPNQQVPDDTINPSVTAQQNKSTPVVPLINNPATTPVKAQDISTNTNPAPTPAEIAPVIDNNAGQPTSQSAAVVAPVVQPVAQPDMQPVATIKQVENKKPKQKVVATIKNKKSAQLASKASLKPHHKDVTPSPFDNNGLAKLQESTWVIQLGSFKNKSNALRLVNQLRANGYKAFIQQISVSMGESTTRVFVGPEDKQANARQLAAELESHLHLKGFVISYQPLTL